ncbi:MAG: tRNA (adenosine(37)-N6)-threonylcarbamoyltransferase complex ATPase subunit type 1 TsaE [Patescibacteria group bacterium]|nr:tRNA (adenosine(37)-N6)-threonylcarbamoyltransferase complex ATPase subunit type 1 TsaE [Patescibacteria group bacterium]
MNGNKIFITNSFEETQNLGKEFAKRLKGGELVALYGNLGAGKTTFVQGLAMGLGIKRRIVSPTFIIIRTYKINNPNFAKASLSRQNSKFFYHVDLYRTETPDDIKGLGIDEIIGNSDNIIVVEWAEKMREFLPEKRIDIYFEYLNENKRKIKFINNGTSN